jgi:hypothetical protein
MTFQVGIVGIDGVLLASDRKYSDLMGQTWEASKMGKSHAGIAYCSSGDSCAARVAREYAESFSAGESPALDGEHLDLEPDGLSEARNIIESKLGEVRKKKMDEWAEEIPNFYCKGDLLIAQKNNGKVQLWHADVITPLCRCDYPQLIDDKRWIGDKWNTAAFVLERYLPMGKLRPIQELKLIAAHAVLMAGKLNPSGVYGLEMMLCPDSGDFEVVNAAEIRELNRKSELLDRDIGKRLLSESPEQYLK